MRRLIVPSYHGCSHYYYHYHYDYPTSMNPTTTTTTAVTPPHPRTPTTRLYYEMTVAYGKWTGQRLVVTSPPDYDDCVFHLQLHPQLILLLRL